VIWPTDGRYPFPDPDHPGVLGTSAARWLEAARVTAPARAGVRLDRAADEPHALVNPPRFHLTWSWSDFLFALTLTHDPRTYGR